MRKVLFFLFTFLVAFVSLAQTLQPPDKVYEELFTAVQTSRIFPDSKTFVDCIPKKDPKLILEEYRATKKNPAIRFSLKLFVEDNFIIPQSPTDTFATKEKDVVAHINMLWKVLERKKDSTVNGSSLIPLPYPYLVPGGRFREIYYWDSYFTMLGLKESGRYDLMENMVENFAYLIEQFGHIPNGNRTYYLSRSQPPFFSLMIDLLASVKGDSIYFQYANVLQKEFNYWTHNNGFDLTYTKSKSVLLFYDLQKRSVSINRYWDEMNIPRQESFTEDIIVADEASNNFFKQRSKTPQKKLDSFNSVVFKNLRAAAASGWDFSSRWFANAHEISTIRTLNIAAVDLNCLLVFLHSALLRSQPLSGDSLVKQMFYLKDQLTSSLEALHDIRQKQYRKLFFNQQLGWYCDFDLVTKKVMNNPTLAGMFPLFFKLADKKDVPRIVAFLKKNFLKDGGVVTSLHNTGQQWDAPNGWAPLQWITIIGLENYGYHKLAKEVARRWVNLNKKVFRDTGKLMEKYDVVNMNKLAGGGEYPSQDGFGWTNGVLLALINKYGFKD